MQDAKEVARIRPKYRALRPEMDERMRRQWAAAEARELDWGGILLVANATGLSRPTISAGMRELKLPSKKRSAVAQRVRRPGAGRKRLLDVDPRLASALEALIEPGTRGDPESPLRWTCKSTRRLAEAASSASGLLAVALNLYLGCASPLVSLANPGYQLPKLRFFAGLTIAQAAKTLGASVTTAENDWVYARSWLRREMGREL